jgi:UDP-glucuronate decarboxylase
VKRVVVTGGAGFLGSYLCESLIDMGNEVLCVDNFFTGRHQNISHLLDYNNFKLIDHDITIPFAAEADEIYNLACPASPLHYQSDPVKTIKTAVVGALNMLDMASQSGAKIFQASTSEVYGDPKIHPQSESYRGAVNQIGPRACYDEGKRCAETLFFDYNRQYETRIKVARIFNTYGPRMLPDDGRVISNFIVNALKNQDIIIYGTGEQTRSFCYYSEIIDGIIKMMNSRDGFPGPVNLGNPFEIRIKELAEIIIELTGSASEIIHGPMVEDDPYRRKPDISLAKEELGWEPHILLRDGLLKTIEYFDNIFRSY